MTSKEEAKSTPKNIEQAMINGDLWLAREHYQSLVRVCGFDQKVYQDFANLLIEMREDLVAGRFYFLAGDRSHKAQKCISKFLDRYKRTKFGSIQSQFPKSAQKMKIREFPEPIRSELIAWGFEDFPTQDNEPKSSDVFWSVTGPLLIILVVASIPIGLFTIIRWIFT